MEAKINRLSSSALEGGMVGCIVRPSVSILGDHPTEFHQKRMHLTGQLNQLTPMGDSQIGEDFFAVRREMYFRDTMITQRFMPPNQPQTFCPID